MGPEAELLPGFYVSGADTFLNIMFINVIRQHTGN